MKSKFENVFQVAAHRLCVGCGTCFYICPEKRVRLIDIEEDGIRPTIEPGGCGACDLCLKACPGLDTTLPMDQLSKKSNGQEDKRWGRILEIWEGFAGDSEIRFKGSSGGLCTALTLFCLDEEQIRVSELE